MKDRRQSSACPMVDVLHACQIVRGSSGWYRIEKHPEGHWLGRAGPYRTRDDARDLFRSEPIQERRDGASQSRPDIARGWSEWYVVVQAKSGRWAQLAGPFKSRAEAREWLGSCSIV
jgi:hypothetical protein